ncbi:Peptidase family M23 [Algoriphagus alkaliphilus]|uniref:Peptidase family M23 n=1 Tax=Algoriphagus alkaliphilus TaxID=279824 RepID=A0A1G5Z3L9_9BACT|nr:peptidoglycan DD-metalloendopeptidase family protein [Algoriphagus alkaliphilus]SDA89478.1 Peptidase family M23 [Algoriphagus alkaliphilus]
MNTKWIGATALFLTLGAGAIFQIGKNTGANSTEDIETIDSTGIEKEVFLYGINVTGLNIIEGTVSKNQTLGSILTPFNVPYQIIDEIAKKSKGVFDVRWISANKKFTILQSADSPQAQFFIYEPNPAEYVVFDLDSMEIYKAEKPAIVKTREIGGVIETSLYVDMVKQGISPEIIDQFADLYGWSVDFQRLQKGDLFKVVFEEKVIDDVVVSVSGVQLAYFEHMGLPYHAIPFEQNGQVSFFDQNGNSFKKAFLRDPLKYTRISSKYNLNRFHPVQKRFKAHLGTDYAAATGTEIRSVGDGTVVEARYTSANGNYVKIKHNGTYTTQYLHMSKIGKGISPGTRIRQGQVIGYVGSTGLATGPHLCFRFWKNGKQEDWLKEKIPPSEPVLQANRGAFNAKRDESLRLLAEISTNGEKKLVAEIPNQTQTAEQ